MDTKQDTKIDLGGLLSSTVSKTKIDTWQSSDNKDQYLEQSISHRKIIRVRESNYLFHISHFLHYLLTFRQMFKIY